MKSALPLFQLLRLRWPIYDQFGRRLLYPNGVVREVQPSNEYDPNDPRVPHFVAIELDGAFEM